MTRILVSNILITLIASAAPAAAQSDAIVQGQVTAALDRSVLPGATVTLQPVAGGAPKETTTDAAGRFALSQVAPERYVVSVAMDGFESRQYEVTMEPREVRTLSVALAVARL